MSQEGGSVHKSPNADGEARCASCRRPLWSVYYQVRGQLSCERCKTDVELGGTQGSGLGRFLRAGLFGTGAGALGAALWYGVRAATDYEVGLIAIVVGLMVGLAVRAGSRGRGGWLYQSLALFLTYTAIVSTYVPFILEGLKQHARESAPVTSPADAQAPAGAPATREGPAPGPGEAGPVPVLLAVALVGAFVMALAFAAPFLMGAQNLMGLAIIAIGLFEAWRVNRRVPLEIEGPFRVGDPPSRPAGA